MLDFSRCWSRATEKSAHFTSFNSLGSPVAGSNLSMVLAILSLLLAIVFSFLTGPCYYTLVFHIPAS